MIKLRKQLILNRMFTCKRMITCAGGAQEMAVMILMLINLIIALKFIN